MNEAMMDRRMKKNLKKYAVMILGRIWLPVMLAVLAAGSVYFIKNRTYEEKYRARVKLILVADDAGQRVNIYDLLRSSQMAMGDICEIIDSETVLSEVQKDCSVSLSYIRQVLSIEAIPNTRILNLTVQTGTPDKALMLIRSLEKNLREKLVDIDGNVTYRLLSEPHVDSHPVNGNHTMLYSAAAAAGGFLIGCIINLLLAEFKIGIKSLNEVSLLFEGKKILPVPGYRPVKAGQEGDGL